MDQFMHWSTTQLNDEIINLLSQGDAYKRTCYQNSNNNENADFVICSHAQEGTVGEMTQITCNQYSEVYCHLPCIAKH